MAKVQRVPRAAYGRELVRLQIELAHLKDWVLETGCRLVVIFEGRDAAGKGGAIKAIAEHLSPRAVRTVALPAPTERETKQWYFQRYIEHLPATGEIVLFDRSWYNRAGVELVMGFCTPEQHELFLRQAPVFERLLVEDGIVLLKYWFSVSDEEQHRRLAARAKDPLKQWKLTPMDLASRTHWVDYSRAKDLMLTRTDIPEAPWWIVEADDKRTARINCIAHLLSSVPYTFTHTPAVKLPARQKQRNYVRPARETYRHVPDRAAGLRKAVREPV
jgi:polyphosphate kinase 2